MKSGASEIEKDANSLVALTRITKGPKGQPKGTITTSPKEIDDIIKKVYGKLYKGNAADVEEYIRQYGPKGMNVIYQAPEATMDEITAEDLE